MPNLRNYRFYMRNNLKFKRLLLLLWVFMIVKVMLSHCGLKALAVGRLNVQ